MGLTRHNARMDLKPLIALLAIVNPIGVIPFFIHFTQSFTREQRRRTIRVARVQRLHRDRASARSPG